METAKIRKKIDEIKGKIRQKSSREARTAGNPNQSDLDRELANAGKKRQPEDIPTQDKKTRMGDTIQGNTDTYFESSTVATRKAYKIGNPVRPSITHDKGFSILAKRPPTLNDYWELLKWTAMLEGAETLRPDLIDGTAAYAHFLNGEGKPRLFSYDRYVNNDSSGRITLRNAILEAQDAAISLWKNNKQPNKFSFTGPAIPCGSNTPVKQFSYIKKAFPYPATENWQKAIGAHVIWISGTVTAKKHPTKTELNEFTMDMTIHAEDQYNFNPGAEDIVSGIPDDDNGQLVVAGLAHGYRNSSTLRRRLSWKGYTLGVSSMGMNIQIRQRKPSVIKGGR